MLASLFCATERNDFPDVAVAVVAEAVADTRHVAGLRVVAVADDVIALAVDDLADAAEIGDVVAHEVHHHTPTSSPATNAPVRDCVAASATTNAALNAQPAHRARRHPQHNGNNTQIIAAA